MIEIKESLKQVTSALAEQEETSLAALKCNICDNKSSSNTTLKTHNTKKHYTEILREDDHNVSLQLSTATKDRDIIHNDVSYELQFSPHAVNSQEETADENSEDESDYESESFECNYCGDNFLESKPLYAYWVEKLNVCKMCLGYGFKMDCCPECGASRL